METLVMVLRSTCDHRGHPKGQTRSFTHHRKAGALSLSYFLGPKAQIFRINQALPAARMYKSSSATITTPPSPEWMPVPVLRVLLLMWPGLWLHSRDFTPCSFFPGWSPITEDRAVLEEILSTRLVGWACALLSLILQSSRVRWGNFSNSTASKKRVTKTSFAPVSAGSSPEQHGSCQPAGRAAHPLPC